MNSDNLTIKSFREGLLAKKFSAAEFIRESFARIDGRDGAIGAFLGLSREKALAEAAAVDELIAAREDIPLLAGVSVAVKDNILIEGVRATAASKILENYTASYDAHVIKKLKAQKAVFLGKTNLDEFAMGSSTENSAFKPTKNPYDLTRVPGGSSGGSAAAVAAGFALTALGSDTSGSICLPAAFCGVVGLRPSYGAVSRSGLIAMGSSLDQIGPITRTVEDAEMVFDAVRGRDPLDSTTADISEKPLPPEAIRKMTIGIPREFFAEGIDPYVLKGLEEARKKLESLGVVFREISLPHAKYALSVYYIIMPAEISTNLARFDGIRYGTRTAKAGFKDLTDLYRKNRGTGFGSESRRRILLGTFVLSAGYYDAYYAKAQKVRTLIKRDFDESFEKVDAIFAPVSPTPAFKMGEKMNDPLQMYLSDIFTTQTNLAGIPALSVPVKRYSLDGKELPVGFQLIGRKFREADILGLGKLYEKI
jgi:aspartyl-tRNA(Asn)/glutamyl-tRNA(Gln) amidotransferase subunit A